MLVPFYDCADNRLLDMLPPDKVDRYLSKGTAHAIYSKAGRVVRLYSIAAGRVHGSIGAAVSALHSAASQTTQRIRNQEGTLIAPPTSREHKTLCANAIAETLRKQ
jgi:hypothetical protein